AVHKIINPLLKSHYPKTTYQLKHVIGVDTSELFVTRIGVRNDYDLVWVGRAANYAAKLCNMNGKYSINITCDVFDAMSPNVKPDRKDNSLMWVERVWKARNSMRIYGSNRWMIV